MGILIRIPCTVRFPGKPIGTYIRKYSNLMVVKTFGLSCIITFFIFYRKSQEVTNKKQNMIKENKESWTEFMHVSRWTLIL